MEYLASVLTLTFGTTRMANLSALRAGRYSFLFEAEWTLGLLNADRWNSSLQNFQVPPEIEPGTSRLMTQCLNRLWHHPCPHMRRDMKLV